METKQLKFLKFSPHITLLKSLNLVNKTRAKFQLPVNYPIQIVFIFVFFIGIPHYTSAQYTTPDSISENVDFIKNQHRSAKEYILDLFNRYNIVIFGERIHDELTQYYLLKDLFSDPRFYNQVGNIFMEIGGSNFDGMINRYLLSSGLTPSQSNEKALEIQRNSSWYPSWVNYNYHYLLTSLYGINKDLPSDKKLKLHPTDIAIDWQQIKTREDVIKKILAPEIQDGRDSVMASNILAFVRENSKQKDTRKKYFVILNLPHAANGVYNIQGIATKSAASYIIENYPITTANVLINSQNNKGIISTTIMSPETVPILDGKMDAAFEYTGIDDLGFDINNSPLQGRVFEDLPMNDTNTTYEKVFTGYLFYKAFPAHELVVGVPGLVDEKFLPELKRRYSLFGWPQNDEQLFQLNTIMNKRPDGLVSFWQKVSYWAGGGKTVSGFYNQSKSIDETLKFILDEKAKGSNTIFNVSEMGLNVFGYSLSSQGKDEDALKIFELNTRLYPNAANTYDSYGEILLKLNRTQEALKAYKKALELNPKNMNASQIINQLEKQLNNK